MLFVIELPYPYATQSADIFAQGAIRLLTLANVNHMVFGSECNDIEKLKHLSEQAAALPVQKALQFVFTGAGQTANRQGSGIQS